MGTVEEVVECNSEDGVRIELTVRYQYLPREKSLYKLTKMYTEHKEDSDSEFEYIYDKVLAWQARAAIRNGCAKYAAQEFQTQRGLVQTEIYTLLSERLDRFMHTDVIDVQLVYIKRPPEYESEVDAKESARNDIDKANNEALLTYIATRLRGSVAATISLDGP